jgi:hypothetical protein
MIAPVSGGEPGDIYIGSTTRERLSQRMMGHRAGYKMWKNGKHHKTTSYDIFEKYGQQNCQITLIEQVNASGKDELNARERYHIDSCDCVNKIRPGRSLSEWQSANRDRLSEYHAEYYQANRDRLLEQMSEYRSNQTNIETTVLYNKEYYIKNKAHIMKQTSEFYQANKNKINLQRQEKYAKKKLQQSEAESST